jgi:hypothetical protein
MNLPYRHDEPRVQVVELGTPWSFDGVGLEIFEAGHVIRVPLADFSEKASPAHILTKPKIYRRSFQKSKLRSQARLLSLKMIDYPIHYLQVDLLKGPQRLGNLAFSMLFDQRLMLARSPLGKRWK